MTQCINETRGKESLYEPLIILDQSIFAFFWEVVFDVILVILISFFLEIPVFLLPYPAFITNHFQEEQYSSTSKYIKTNQKNKTEALAVFFCSKHDGFYL